MAVAMSAISLLIVSGNSCETLAQIQQAVGPGSTPQGDMVRGEGVFLQGLGWFELNDAKAAAQNADTMMKLERWNREVQLAYRKEYNAAAEREMTKRRMNDSARKQFLAEREARLRDKPTPEDIQKGDALNALLTDLSDPTIHESSWRGAKVALPPELSIRNLAFQFAAKPGAKGSQELSRSLIALGRLDTEGRWPIYLAGDGLKAEREAYEAAYRSVRDKSLAGKLGIEEVLRLDGQVEKVRIKAASVVPVERGFRSFATKYVLTIKEASRMFDADTIGFAQEMIADTHRHEAHTVGELLAFMRKYRLLFTAADKAPGGAEMYSRLYGLMREQEELLGIGKGAAEGAARSTRRVPATITAGRWKIEGQDLVLDSTGQNEFCIFGEETWSDFDLAFEAEAERGREGFFARVHQSDDTHFAKIGFGAYGNSAHILQVASPKNQHEIITRLPGRIIYKKIIQF
jgi:hypothetical protein